MLNGCGANKGIIEKVSLSSTKESGAVWVEMVADLRQAGFQLPEVTLPIQNPKNQTQNIGTISLSALQIKARVNSSELINIPSGDGSKLPNGSVVPVVLEGGAIPIGIPVSGSKSMIYFSLNDKQIMLGVAATLLKEDKLNYPTNIFFPFQISEKLKGLGGFFLGETQGIGVFALASLPDLSSTTVSTAVMASNASVERLSRVSQMVSADSSIGKLPEIKLRDEKVTNSKLKRLLRTSQYYSGQLQMD